MRTMKTNEHKLSQEIIGLEQKLYSLKHKKEVKEFQDKQKKRNLFIPSKKNYSKKKRKRTMELAGIKPELYISKKAEWKNFFSLLKELKQVSKTIKKNSKDKVVDADLAFRFLKLTDNIKNTAVNIESRIKKTKKNDYSISNSSLDSQLFMPPFANIPAEEYQSKSSMMNTMDLLQKFHSINSPIGAIAPNSSYNIIVNEVEKNEIASKINKIIESREYTFEESSISDSLKPYNKIILVNSIEPQNTFNKALRICV